jgi:acid phosphatase family membrane protein YuiD
LLYLTAALPLAVAGPGRYSLDALLGLETGLHPERAWVAMEAAVVVAFACLALRRVAPAPARTYA